VLAIIRSGVEIGNGVERTFFNSYLLSNPRFVFYQNQVKNKLTVPYIFL
jgi:hypothetical protein